MFHKKQTNKKKVNKSKRPVDDYQQMLKQFEQWRVAPGTKCSDETEIKLDSVGNLSKKGILSEKQTLDISVGNPLEVDSDQNLNEGDDFSEDWQDDVDIEEFLSQLSPDGSFKTPDGDGMISKGLLSVRHCF